jgi:hypothetical protein
VLGELEPSWGSWKRRVELDGAQERMKQEGSNLAMRYDFPDVTKCRRQRIHENGR